MYIHTLAAWRAHKAAANLQHRRSDGHFVFIAFKRNRLTSSSRLILCINAKGTIINII